MNASTAPGSVDTPRAASGAEHVLDVVNEFYEANPFPGFDPASTRREWTW